MKKRTATDPNQNLSGEACIYPRSSCNVLSQRRKKILRGAIDKSGVAA